MWPLRPRSNNTVTRAWFIAILFNIRSQKSVADFFQYNGWFLSDIFNTSANFISFQILSLSRYLYFYWKQFNSPYLSASCTTSTLAVAYAALRPGCCLPRDALTRVIARVILDCWPWTWPTLSDWKLNDSRCSISKPRTTDGVTESPLGPLRQFTVHRTVKIAGLCQILWSSTQFSVDNAMWPELS